MKHKCIRLPFGTFQFTNYCLTIFRNGIPEYFVDNIIYGSECNFRLKKLWVCKEHFLHFKQNFLCCRNFIRSDTVQCIAVNVKEENFLASSIFHGICFQERLDPLALVHARFHRNNVIGAVVKFYCGDQLIEGSGTGWLKTQNTK